MKIKTTAISAIFALTGVICGSGSAWGQAAPGPLQPSDQQQTPSDSPASAPAPHARTQANDAPARDATPKQDFAGSWKLNRRDSDDAREKMRDATQNSGASGGQGGNGPYGNGPYGRRGPMGGGPIGGGYPYPGGGPGGGQGGPWGGGPNGGNGNDGRAGMQEVMNPAESLTIAKKSTDVTVTDDQNRQRVYITDGRKPRKSKDADYREIPAHWENDRLVATEKDARGGELRRSFELSPDKIHLYEMIDLDATRNRSAVNIRYVYDVADTKQP